MHKTKLYLLLKNRRHHLDSTSKKVRSIARPLGFGMMSIALIALLGAIVFAGVAYARIVRDLPSLDELPVLLNPVDGELLQPTLILDRTGSSVLATLDNPGIQRRYLAVNPEQNVHFNPQLVRAVIFQLDPSFWQNSGYSLKNLTDPNPSTIAERLVSELLLWREPETSTRAIRMRLLAAQTVNRFGRTQVLEWFLNSAYFGHRAFGADSAAQLYFQKSAQDLTLAESALLAVLIKAPALNPLDVPGNALELQQQLLADMAQSLTITTDEFSAAVKEKNFLRTEIAEPTTATPAFTEMVENSLSPGFGQNRLARGGLIVVSTLDLSLQQQLACTTQIQLQRLGGHPEAGYESVGSNCPAALLLPTQVLENVDINNLASGGVVMDPSLGQVLAYQTPTQSDGQTANNTSLEPGSLLSPFAALAGFARGLSPASLKWDVPLNQAGTVIEFQNPDHAYHGPVSLRSALANDYLVPIVEEVRQVGAFNAWNLASLLGWTSMGRVADNEQPLFSGAKTSFLNVASAYSSLANAGIRVGILDTADDQIKPNLVLKVITTTRRVILENTSPDTSKVLSESLAYLINHVLSDESARWPSLGFPNALEIGQTAASKIGQVADARQVWTIGYTPQRLTLVWIGAANPTEESPRLDPRIAAGLWHAVIRQSLLNIENPGWNAPAGVTLVNVCVPSGMLPSQDCPNTRDEVFLIGNEPFLADTLYEQVKVNRETGQRATVFTEPGLIEEQLFINVPNYARQWALESGLAVAPTGYDAIPFSEENPEVSITSPALFGAVSGKVNIMGNADASNFSSYSVQVGEGINPDSWVQVGASTQAGVLDAKLAEWDTTGLEGLYAIRLTVIDANQGVQTAVIQVTVDNTPPSVKVTNPGANQIVEGVHGSVTLSAVVQESVGLSTLEWWLDGVKVASQNTGPFVYVMDAVKGNHKLEIKAIDTAGNITTSEKIVFTIAP
jgi:membrane peptidoglycan carboxypeptidase